MPSEANNGFSKPSPGSAELRAEALLGRVASRDIQALASLYDEFAPTLMGMLVRMLSTKAEAESALQEVFLRLWKEAPDLAQTNGSVAVWLVMMARQAGFQRLRARRLGATRPVQSPHRPGRRKAGKPAEASVESTPGERKSRERPANKQGSQSWLSLAASAPLWLPRPEEITLAEGRLDLLQRAFNQMPKPQRSALELAVFEAYTEPEIAAHLGEPLGKVNAGLRAAFIFLRHRQHAVLGTWTADI